MPVPAADASECTESLRCDESPYQGAAVYCEIDESSEDEEADDEVRAPGITNTRQLHGRAMNYNNYTDDDAALRAAYDHERPCVAIIKHANPCDTVATGGVVEAHRLAHICDPVSVFGDMITVNRPVSVKLTRQIVPILTEVVLAPDYEEGASEVPGAKESLRVLQVEPPARGSCEFRRISGGLLVQERDDTDMPNDSSENWMLTAGAPTDEATLMDLKFAWRTVCVAHSNAILLVKNGAPAGIGMGQVNRMDPCKLTVERANTLGSRSTGDVAASSADDMGGARTSEVVGDTLEQRSIGMVAASSAFFPLTNGLQVFIDTNVEAVVQPGGSMRDQESVDAANVAGTAIYLMGMRHFTH